MSETVDECMSMSGASQAVEKGKINPEYVNADYLVVWMYFGAPSIEQQIAHDSEVQERLEKALMRASEALRI